MAKPKDTVDVADAPIVEATPVVEETSVVVPAPVTVRRYPTIEFATKEDFAAFIEKLKLMAPAQYERNAEEFAHQLDTFYL